MRKLFTAFALAVVVGGCQHNENSAPFLSPDNLESLIIKVTAETDTLIVTPQGAKIKIVKGTFNEETELEIKEAYSIKDMLLGGLTTESDSTLLQSGGMVYINTLDGAPLKLNKSIGITIPGEYVEENMKLFTGTQVAGGISWDSAFPFDSTPTLKSIQNGKVVFQKCQSCHQMFRDATGPPVVVWESPDHWSDRKEMLKFIQNTSRYVATNEYARNLKEKYGSVMPMFPDMTLKDLDDLMNFMENEKKRYVANGTIIDYSFPITFKTDSSSISDLSVIKQVPEISAYVDTFPTAEALRYGFTDGIQFDDKYDFQIQTLGWYNVDAEMPGLPGSISCKLDVNLDSAPMNNMSVYLFVPGRKNLSVGINEGDGKFSFNKYNNSIPLVLNDKAFLLAFGNEGEKFYYGIAGFTVEKDQQIKIQIKLSTREQLLQAIKSEKLEGLDMKIRKQQ